MTRCNDEATIKADGELALAPENTPWHFDPMRHAKCGDRQTAADDLLGPYPDQTVAVFHDLGLNDVEIARYFGVSPRRIKSFSDGGQRSDHSRSLREIANLMRVKLFGGTI